MHLRQILFLFLSIFAFPLSATSIFDQLQEAAGEEPLAINLTVALDSLVSSTVGKQPALAEYVDAAGVLQQWKLKVAIRGKYRRLHCAQVPLKLDFRKRDLEAAGLVRFDDYKLVLPCTHHRAAKTRLLKEYLAYQAYNLLTPASFRVQLIALTLKDAAGQEDDQMMTAFLIENTDELAARTNNLIVEENLGQPASAYLPKAEAIQAFFQYLIGNTDWNNTLAMNTKTLRNANGKLLPVGYDFDFSNWVNAPYALPRRELGQEFLSQRVYLGFVQPDDVLQQVADHFLKHQQAILSLIASSELPTSQKRPLTRFIDSFYDDISHYREHDMMMLYGRLRGLQADFIPAGAMAEDFETMEE